MERLIAAAADEAEERPYADISVRTIAKRAGVAPATAYTYFSGKDHLLAEVLWRRMQGVPEPGRPHAAAARPGGRHRPHHGLRRHGLGGRGRVHDGAAR